jgi:hypothetical protein
VFVKLATSIVSSAGQPVLNSEGSEAAHDFVSGAQLFGAMLVDALAE